MLTPGVTVSETVKLRSNDGHELDAYVARPAGAAKGGVVVLQEIFGVNAHIRSVADRLASAGYVAIAPAIFDRYQRGFEVGYDPEGMRLGMDILKRFNREWAYADTEAAFAHVQTTDRLSVGIVGFCLGGSLAWLAATRLPATAVVGYYGGQIAGSMNDLMPIAPVMLHFGKLDAHIPMSDVDAIQRAHPDVTIYRYEAGHGFNCDARASYSSPAATEAWDRTLTFLGSH
jgi:carboxymethylenebutenolidase